MDQPTQTSGTFTEALTDAVTRALTKSLDLPPNETDVTLDYRPDQGHYVVRVTNQPG